MLRILGDELLLESQFLGGVFLLAGLLKQLPFRCAAVDFRKLVTLRPSRRGDERQGKKGGDGLHAYLLDSAEC